MVLRRDPATLTGGVRDPPLERPNSATGMANEQPVTKRQRIESKNAPMEDATKIAPPDIIASPQQPQLNGASTSTSSSPTVVADGASRCPAGDEIDNVQRRLAVDGETRISPSFPDLLKVHTTAPPDGDLAEVHTHLMKQCLCGVSERAMRRLFRMENGKRSGVLKEWPAVRTMQFLSNIQLLFEVYLPQNIKGFICLRVLEACERLLLQELALIDEITQLCDHENRFVRFLAGRVLASFLLIAKKYMNVASEKLKPIVENFMALETIDEATMRRVAISAEILRRIVEWKDMEEHPLDEDDEEDDEPPPVQPPPLETNYFATHYNPEMVAAATSSTAGSLRTPGAPHPIVRVTENGCQLVTLTDSESFDSGTLKFDMIETLKEEWPSIVERMSTVIGSWAEIAATEGSVLAEECILAFLAFWESIISVRANLPIVQTLYFHEPLNDLRKLLSRDLPATVYKQMLTLFNEALCYGSTLALQDLLPKATCSFAAQIVLQVRRGWLLRSLPQERVDNHVNFTGRRGENVSYDEHTLSHRIPAETSDSRTVDKPLLQKLVLLVLKSVAVTAKEVRSDSSDSSIESTDFQAVQDIKTIEESIRDALKKLEDFMKDIMELHPETHFSNILIRLFDDQDDYLIEAMVCTLDVTVNMSFRNNAFPELVAMLNPVFTFLEFLNMITYSGSLLLDLLISNETCFLLYLLRFLKYIRLNWSMFVTSCQESSVGNNCLDDAMSVLIRLKMQIQSLVAMSRFPYDIGPVQSLLRICEGLYEGDGLS
ncbi:protein lines [Lutzomyia longipalpis]|uniref:protein lines n=1 Tax=Lutzomyia longipalpis TaxID=7200 RepID=UPI0024844894|nr:protein lines [Lutzomyia longipalpis]